MTADANDPRGEADNGRERWLDRLMQRFGSRGSRDTMRDDLEEVLAEATQTAEFSAHERAMLKNVLGLHRVRVSDVMVPRVDIAAVAVGATLGETLELFRTAGHSRLPTYGETLDEPLGMVHIRDFVVYLADNAGPLPDMPGEANGGRTSLGDVDLSKTLAEADVLRPVLFVPRSMPAIDLLARMQTSRTHMALVIDEYGGTDGLVSIENLIETVVGDIEDEHDETAAMILQGEGGSFVADARASLEEVSAALGRDLAVGQDAEEIDTLGGLIVTRVGRVPSRGELIAGPGDLEFEVLDADPRRLKRVRIYPRPVDGTVDASSAPDRTSPAVPAVPEPGQAD